ncbi:hypothetical protein BDZ91DRAFT_743264 [Kalaharituber pfeilii]|nr:hypothetical protein BDZ91DRAFT_743264 [Kalaharituber pfeilii]
MPSSKFNAGRQTTFRRRGGGGVSSYAATPIVGIAKGLLVLSANLPRLIHAIPTSSHPRPKPHHPVHHASESSPINIGDRFPAKPVDEAGFWINAGVAMFLVLMGGLFAGLTLGLMGQDEIYLQVIEQSGEGAERIHAHRVLRLLQKGKHWVLVTLLLSNVITNETLPIVLDRSLGGGWPAVVTSTVLIVIFGEIIPQSVCVRYGLAIGSYLSPFVLGLMYLMYPVGKPTAMLLDYILGEDHGTVYKKAGLKTLVTLHKTLGPSPSDRLNQDEVTIISAVLDLKDKPVVSIMTPIKDVFTMCSDDVLDEKTMNEILSAGYSRIPIHAPGEPTNFVGMLLVKILITYDPEDAMKVKDFPLATLPETAPDTSCLDIVNFFQEGKSHMVLVSSSPGENYGALGVVTLEDVIEELIGEEIIDESDVYIDVHKAIRRINPFPLTRRNFSSQYASRTTDSALAASALAAAVGGANNANATNVNTEGSPLIATDDANAEENSRRQSTQIPQDVITHLKHLGPSNLASNPKKTSSKTVKIKQGSIDEGSTNKTGSRLRSDSSASNRPGSRGYGAILMDGMADTQADEQGPLITFSESPPRVNNERKVGGTPIEQRNQQQDDSAVGNELGEESIPKLRKAARSGSLVESIKTSGGVPKTVIETTSSSEEGESGESGEGSGNGEKGKENGVKGKENSRGERSPLLKGWGSR